MASAKLFYSYSHKDELYREQLETHLSILKRNGAIQGWNDRRISAGQEWEEEINLNLEEADVILLLVSSNFLASDYCYDTETIRALEKHENKESIVIPIVIKPCLWLESKLSKLQSLPRDNKAISTWANEDEAWVSVAEGILEAVKKVNRSKQNQLAISQSPVEGTSDTMPLCKIVLDFLTRYNKWYFSPLRIQKWGSSQHGFSALNTFSTKQIQSCLEKLNNEKKVKTTVSQKGNTIYKSIT